ncbi:MAG: ketopantoate reductase family protein, partial [Candidatus Heimdallarchaeota archaeon]|nr:ketopantoate reductase family protein [Candidatus Heimdallarchaeota archaeon]
MSSKNTILIAGLGAIGSILFSRLERKNVKLVCLTSNRGTKEIGTKGLFVQLLTDDTPKLHKVEVYEYLPEKYKFKQCIVATKAYNNQILADYLVDYMADDSSILLFQNGIDVEKPFTEKEKDWKITRAVSSVGAFRDEKGVTETAIGETKLGVINYTDVDEIEQWKELLLSLGLEALIPEDLNKNFAYHYYLKAIVNSTINPIGSITKLKNGDIIKDKQLLDLIERTVDEIITILAGIMTISKSDALETIYKIARTTSDNKCSMLQDIEKGIKTEIDYLNGKFLEISKRENVEAPINSKLVSII